MFAKAVRGVPLRFTPQRAASQDRPETPRRKLGSHAGSSQFRLSVRMNSRLAPYSAPRRYQCKRCEKSQVLPDMLTRETSASTSVYAAYDLISFADPLVYVAGRPISTDANTQYAYIGRDADQTQLPMTHDLFFSNPHYFPYWDKICTPSINFVVHQNADGSLTAVSILWEPDYC